MPNIQNMLYGIEESFVRPSILCVLKDIKKILCLDPNIYLQISQDDGIKKKVNRVGELKGDNNNKEEWIYVEWEEESIDSKTLSTLPINPEYKPIWEDKDIYANCRVMYQARRLNIRCKYRTLSKSSAQSLANIFRIMTSNDNHTHKHNLEYFYHLGHTVTDLLKEISHLKNLREQEEDKLTLQDYLNKTMDVRADLALTHDGNPNKVELICRERQNGVIGFFSSDVYNITPEYDDEYGQYSIDFDYSILYDKPISILSKFPILVYNSIIDEKFRLATTLDDVHPHADYGRSLQSTYTITTPNRTLKPLTNFDFITIPKEDTPLILPKPPRFITRLFSTIVVVNDEDKKELFNINDIPGIKFKDEVRDFIISEGDNVGTLLNSIFYIELFEDFNKIGNNKITIDTEGNLRTTEDMNIKKTYRVMFNILINIDMLPPKHARRISRYMENNLDESVIENKLIKDPLVFMYLNTFNINTPYVDKNNVMKYSKETIGYTVIDRLWEVMRTVAYNQIIVLPYNMLDEK